jgi:hypothetical protein
MIKRFIDCYKDKDVANEYYAGFIAHDDETFIVTHYQKGAEKLFPLDSQCMTRKE